MQLGNKALAGIVLFLAHTASQVPASCEDPKVGLLGELELVLGTRDRLSCEFGGRYW
jgi:hypothetical protein